MSIDHYPEPGRYGCVHTRGWGPAVIRLGTRSHFDHTFVVIDDRGGIIEAEPGGVRKGNIAEYDGDRMVINAHEPGTADQFAKVADAASKLVGVAYNDIAIVNDGFEALGVHWRLLAKMATGDHGIVCSQLAAMVGQAGGFDWLCGKTVPEVTPADLAKRTGYLVNWVWS